MTGPKTATLVHVVFDDGGNPAWFGPDPVLGSEALDLAELSGLLPPGSGPSPTWPVWREILIRHCRIDGHWIARPVSVAPVPVATEEQFGDTGSEAED